MCVCVCVFRDLIKAITALHNYSVANKASKKPSRHISIFIFYCLTAVLCTAMH